MFKKITIYSLLLSLCLPVLTGCGLNTGPSKAVAQKMAPITLRYWRVFDGEDDFADIISKYNALHPNITIEYKKLRFDEYEQELLEAFATDKGPDVFSIHNTWTRKYQSMGLLMPLPKQISMVFPQIVGSIKKEVQYNERTTNTISPASVGKFFIDTVYNDVVISTKNETTGVAEDNIYGLPLGVDTLVLYYNKDLFNNAGIANAPLYWNREFQQDVKKLTKQNNKGEIVQAGAALGGANNIERTTDILSVLMMQNGTKMMDNGSVKFSQIPEAYSGKDYNPGLEALRFYTDFANPAKEVYTWNETLDNSLDMFITGKLGMMFGYSYMLPMIKSRAPGLNFSISKLPQIEGNTVTKNFANYWVETVSKKSKHPEEAWDFVTFMTQKDNVKTHLEKTNKPTALRSLVDEQLKNEELAVFVDQVLTAESWYEGRNANAAETIMKDMIKEAIVGQTEFSSILNNAAKKVQQTVMGE